MKNKLLTLLLAFVIAFGLWLYVITVVSPNSSDTIYDIRLSIAGETVLGQGDTLSSHTPKAVWELDFDGDTFTISRAGQYLGMRQGFNGIGLGGDHIYVEWKLVDAGDGLYYIQNTETGYYLQWYKSKNNWCGHNDTKGSKRDMFLLRIEPAK